MKSLRGFTIVEALIAVSVIAILAALTIPAFQDSLKRSKVRKTSDLLSQAITMAQNEALRRNVKTYLEVTSTGDICIGTASGGCDLRREALTTGITVTTTQLVLSPFYGIPSPAPANFTVTYFGVSQTVTVNKLGIVTVGDIS